HASRCDSHVVDATLPRLERSGAVTAADGKLVVEGVSGEEIPTGDVERQPRSEPVGRREVELRADVLRITAGCRGRNQTGRRDEGAVLVDFVFRPGGCSAGADREGRRERVRHLATGLNTTVLVVTDRLTEAHA